MQKDLIIKYFTQSKSIVIKDYNQFFEITYKYKNFLLVIFFTTINKNNIDNYVFSIYDKTETDLYFNSSQYNITDINYIDNIKKIIKFFKTFCNYKTGETDEN